MEFSPTAKAILGILAIGPASGYEIKGIVDDSTAFFWAASYGQIYPELKRLEKAGLIAGREDSTGGRAKTTWSLTREGRKVLREWLAEPPETFEMRNEGMLKLFVSEAAGAGDVPSQVAELGAHADDVVRRLSLVRERIDSGDGTPPLCLRLGIEINEFIGEWCRRTLAELDDASGPAGGGKEGNVQRTG